MLLVAALASVAAVPAIAQDQWLRDERAYSGKDAAIAGQFATLQVQTTEPDQFMADWERPTAGVRLVSQDKVKRSRPIVTFVVFRGCKPNAAGACNVTADFTTTAPDGKVYDVSKNVEIWVGLPPPPGRAIQLSRGGLGLAFEPKDPAGEYRIVARTTDHVAGITLQTEKTLTLLPD